jgi:dihydropteroate synthase
MENRLRRTVNSLNCGGRLLFLDPPLVMGILNVTPDSFYDGGKFTQESEIAGRVTQMVEEGAAIIDIGGVSTRPGAPEVPEEEEWKRIAPVLKVVRRLFPEIFISIDTSHAGTAVKAVSEGGDIINDISGGEADTLMFETVARLKVPYVLMHIRGRPSTMQNNPVYENVTREVLHSLLERAGRLKSLGVKDIILDPGFGFGKNITHNYQLLKDLELFTGSGYPVLAGFSRKSMINRVLGTTPETALNGTSVLNTIALMKGVSILRVHDVKEAAEAVKLVTQLHSPHI